MWVRSSGMPCWTRDTLGTQNQRHREENFPNSPQWTGIKKILQNVFQRLHDRKWENNNQSEIPMDDDDCKGVLDHGQSNTDIEAGNLISVGSKRKGIHDSSIRFL